jgi:SAM-dependent methyltransferase
MTSYDPQALYGADYFAAYEDDPRRLAMYEQEVSSVRAYTGAIETVLDIGCGLGDFLEALDPSGKARRFGIEVSSHARAIANKRKVRFHWPDRPNQFDLIVLRGSIQHLDRPIDTLHDCHTWLKPGGHIVFLATPNSESLVYRLFGGLPALHPDYNYWIPGARELRNVLRLVGFDVLKTEYPYWGTPYASPVRDAWRFALRLLSGNRIKLPFAWPGNMMEMYARKA